MKYSSKIGLIFVILTLTSGLAACGDSPTPTVLSSAATTVSQAGTTPSTVATASSTVASAATTAVSVTTVAVITVPATTAVTTTAAPTTQATTTMAATTASPTTVAPTTKAVSTTASVLSNAIRQTDWAKVLQNDPQLKQEPPLDSTFKIYISVKAAEGLAGAPDLTGIIYLDVDKDGLEEAAIPLISGGTAGNIGFLLYRWGQPTPRLVGWQEGYKQGLKTVGGKLVATNAVYSGWEPNCCPSGYSTITYALTGDKLQVASSRTDGYAEAQPPTVDQFYIYINTKELDKAYQFLSDTYQKANPYAKWAAGFANTQQVTTESVTDASAPNTVRVNLETTDKSANGPVIKHFSGTWKLVWSPERTGWLLNEAKIQEVAGTNGSTAKVLPLFQPILASLKQKTPLQIALPTSIEIPAPLKLYAYIEKADTSSYFIELDFAPDCKGSTVCRYGSLAGEVVGLNPQPLKGQKVPLVGGVTGYFTEATCGASCGDATLSWEQGNVRYTVGSKAAKLDTLVKIANSAISNGPV